MTRAICVLALATGGLCRAQADDPAPSHWVAAVVSDMRGSESPGDPAAAGLLALPRPPAAAGTVVSAASLRHKIPKEAAKAFERARRLSRDGNYPQAARELERAVARDPDFAEAWGLLGLHYLRLSRPAEAEAALRRSLALDPSSPAAHANLAALYLTRGDVGAAEASARRSLELSSTNSLAHYLLGLALSRSPATVAEGVAHLRYAARTIPAAGDALAAIMRNK